MLTESCISSEIKTSLFLQKVFIQYSLLLSLLDYLLRSVEFVISVGLCFVFDFFCLILFLCYREFFVCDICQSFINLLVLIYCHLLSDFCFVVVGLYYLLFCLVFLFSGVLCVLIFVAFSVFSC